LEEKVETGYLSRMIEEKGSQCQRAVRMGRGARKALAGGIRRRIHFPMKDQCIRDEPAKVGSKETEWNMFH